MFFKLKIIHFRTSSNCCISELSPPTTESILKEFHVERVFGMGLQNEDDQLDKIFKVTSSDSYLDLDVDRFEVIFFFTVRCKSF